MMIKGQNPGTSDEKSTGNAAIRHIRSGAVRLSEERWRRTRILIFAALSVLLPLSWAVPALASGTEHSVIVDSGGDVGYRPSLAVVDGNPAIAYVDYTNSTLKYARATNTEGTTWGTPRTISLGGAIRISTHKLEMIVVAGRPAIAFYDSNGDDVYFIRALDAQGNSWGTPICVDCGSDDRGRHLSMTVVNGNPAIVYNDYWTEEIYFVRATNATGTSWGSPVMVNAEYGEDIEIVIANGRPAISYIEYYGYEVVYIRASDANGSAWGTPQVLDTVTARDEVAMAIVNGNPAVAYYDVTSEVLYYKRASNADGSSWGSRIVVRENDNVDSYHDLQVVDGYPTIAYQRNSVDQTDDDLALIQASDGNGTTWKEPRILLSNGDIGTTNAMVPLASGLGVATYDNTAYDLYYFNYSGAVEPPPPAAITTSRFGTSSSSGPLFPFIVAIVLASTSVWVLRQRRYEARMNPNNRPASAGS